MKRQPLSAVNTWPSPCAALAAPFALLACLLAAAPSVAARTGETLERLRDDLQTERTERAAVSELRTLGRDRSVPDTLRLPARALLARHLRNQGKTADALKLVAPHADFKPENIRPPSLGCFLEAALCRAAEGQVRDALKRLRFAESHAEDLALMRVFAARADLFLQAGGFKKAVSAYEDTLSQGNRHFRPRRVSESEAPKPVPGADQWRELRKSIQKRLAEARKQWDIARYGKGFAYYRIARRAERDGNREYAVTVYELLARMVPDSVYADAAAFHRALLLEKIGLDDQANDAFRDFLRADPLGLYRGEAWLHLGENALLRDLDARSARRHFSRTLDWIQRVTDRRRQIDLHIVPEKARDITAPPVAPLQRTEWGALVPPDETPEMLVNRQTADWYLDRLAWRAGFHLGFLDFVNRNYDQAHQRWTQAFELNKQLQTQHKTQLGSFYRRLLFACQGHQLIARRKEMKAFPRGSSKRVKLMLADFHALWLRWEPAERLYKELLEEDLRPKQEATVLHCLAVAKAQQHDFDRAATLHQTILRDFSDTPSAQYSYAYLAERADPETQYEMQFRYFRKAYEMDPQGAEGVGYLLLALGVSWAQENTEKAAQRAREFLELCPDTPTFSAYRDRAKRILSQAKKGICSVQSSLDELVQQERMTPERRDQILESVRASRREQKKKREKGEKQ